MPSLRTPRAVPAGNRTARTTKDTSRTREDRIGERIAVQPDGCWQWTGATNPGGYGVSGGDNIHRYVYELLVGPIPDGHHLHHDCRNPACCRPSHLTPLTPSEHSALPRSEV